jgi:hypothetical protein
MRYIIGIKFVVKVTILGFLWFDSRFLGLAAGHEPPAPMWHDCGLWEKGEKEGV